MKIRGLVGSGWWGCVGWQRQADRASAGRAQECSTTPALPCLAVGLPQTCCLGDDACVGGWELKIRGLVGAGVEL